jgi:hypothetical protein
MPDDADHRAAMNPPPEGGDLHSFRSPTEPAHNGVPQATRALVDGVGVYTASLTSPFLTAPTASNGALVGPESPAIDPPDILADQLQELREPLRRQVLTLPLRLRLSEEEVSGLVRAVLDVVARHLSIAYAEAHRTHFGR